ncbi:MAG: hypothetical protein AAB361_02910 [Patescibacteria group bacterium]
MPVEINNRLKQQIIESLNLKSYTARQQEKIISKLMDNAFSKTFIAIMDMLLEDEKKELLRMVKTKNKEAVLNYLNSRIKNFSLLPEEITEETIKGLKKLRAVR